MQVCSLIWNMNLIARIVVIVTSIYGVYALCNTCSDITGLACVANDQFELCVSGIPTAPAVKCPTGTVCSADGPICSPQSTTIPSCSRCGSCNSDNTFACITYNTFALCYGTTIPSSFTFRCPGSLVCNVDAAQICVNPTTTGVGGTCPSVASQPNAAVNPQAYCQSVGSAGRYEITTDPNCKEYVLCALVNSTWIGNIYECPGITLFNATSRMCGIEVPARCA